MKVPLIVSILLFNSYLSFSQCTGCIYNPDHTITTIKGCISYNELNEDRWYKRNPVASFTPENAAYAGAYVRSRDVINSFQTIVNSFSVPDAAGKKIYYSPSNYLSQWTEGIAIDSSNERIDSGFLFSFDYKNQLLFFKEKNTDDIFLANNDKISFFSIFTDSIHSFIKASQFIPSDQKDFFEILTLNSNKYSLLKFTKISSKKEHDYYYIFYKNNLLEVKKDLSDLKKIFPSEKEKIAIYSKYNSTNLSNEIYLKGLAEYLNF